MIKSRNEERIIEIGLFNNKGIEYVVTVDKTNIGRYIQNRISFIRTGDFSFIVSDILYDNGKIIPLTEDNPYYVESFDDFRDAVLEFRERIYQKYPYESSRLEELFGKLGTDEIKLENIEDYAETLHEYTKNLNGQKFS